MKRKRKFFGKRLASLTLLASSLPCAFNGQAQITYRGFIEGGLGITIVEKASGSESAGPNGTYGFRNSNYGGGVGFSYMLATTHGIQLKNNFIGLGLAITPGYCAVGDYYYYLKNSPSSSSYTKETTLESYSSPRISKISIPVYFNWRYDFFSTNGSFKPYVGAKVGVYIPFTKFKMDYRYVSSTVYVSSSLTDHYYDEILNDCTSGFLPFFAVEFGLRKRLSESSGISFGLSIQNSNNATAYMNPEYAHGSDLEDSMGLSILAKVAFDF